MMKRDEMVGEIDRLGPSFHRIELSNGVLTRTESVHGEPAAHPLGTWERDRAVVVGRRGRPADLATVPRLGAELLLLEGSSTWAAGSEVWWTIGVNNVGRTLHGSGAPHGGVRLGAHLMGLDGEEVEWDFARADFGEEVATGQVVAVRMRFTGPLKPGAYAVEMDLVREGGGLVRRVWFPTLRREIVVSG
jgi:hypothetical protein